jgi:hypothetical protein
MPVAPLYCPLCSEPFPAPMKLDEHIISDHTGFERTEWILGHAESVREARRNARSEVIEPDGE